VPAAGLPRPWGGTSIPWDRGLSKQHRAHIEGMEGEGRRVMASAIRDLDPDDFDPDGDLLGYVTGLQLTSLVAIVDPPRDESGGARWPAPRPPISWSGW
jgi:P-type Ca2+ transporter type 2C